MEIFKTRTFIFSFLLFVFLNFCIYFFINSFSTAVKFNAYTYLHQSHHYLSDHRVKGIPEGLFRILGQMDAQWYLRIAELGYPASPTNTNIEDKTAMDGLNYAFFPLYPAIIKSFNLVVNNVELSAFILSSLALLISFISLYFIITRLYSAKTAVKTLFLFYTFPFSIFYRSYFSEILFLPLYAWFTYFLTGKKWIGSSILIGLLSVTRPIGLFLFPAYYFFFFKDFKKNRVTLKTFITVLIFSLSPILLWSLFVFYKTGNPFYWVEIQKAWYTGTGIFSPVTSNLNHILNYFRLPYHDFHNSKVDVDMLVLILGLLILSRNKLKKELWLLSLSVWLFPLLTHDLISYSRYQIISFPLYIYLAEKFDDATTAVYVTIFLAGLLIVSLYFVNWYWVG